MTTVLPPICMYCRWRGKGLDCKAYPDGIPQDIVMSRVDHRQPQHGDHGIVFSASTDEGDKYADWLFSLDSPILSTSGAAIEQEAAARKKGWHGMTGPRLPKLPRRDMVEEIELSPEQEAALDAAWAEIHADWERKHPAEAKALRERREQLAREELARGG